MPRLVFIGDICTDSYSVSAVEAFRNTHLYQYLASEDNLVVGNLESPLLENDVLINENKFSLKNRPSLFGLYDFCHAFSLANNHIFDQGVEGYAKTCEHLNWLGKKYFGAGKDLQSARAPLVLECGSEQVGLLAYNCYSTNSEMMANKSSPGAAPLIFDMVQQDIAKLKEHGVKNIIVLPHWGIENQLYPTVDQVAFARKLVDAGACAVIGAHTHTIQSFEVYKGAPIAYSLGNFLFNHFSVGVRDVYYQNKYNKEGMVLELGFAGGTVSFRRKFIGFTADMLPEIRDQNDLATPVGEIDSRLHSLTVNLKHEKVAPELEIKLRYNGAAMQLVYANSVLDTCADVTYETYKAKCKRLLFKYLRRR